MGREEREKMSGEKERKLKNRKKDREREKERRKKEGKHFFFQKNIINNSSINIESFKIKF